MLKVHTWIRIAALIGILLVNLIVGIEAAAGITYTGTLSSGPGANGVSNVTYQVTADLGETLYATLTYSGYNNCGGGWIIVSFDRHGVFPIMGGLLGDYSGSATYAYTATFTPFWDGDVEVKVEIACRHATSVLQSMTMNYTLTIELPDDAEDPYAEEEAAGLHRLTGDMGLPVIVYTPTPDNDALFMDIWQLDEHGVGQPFLYISEAELLALPDFPVENILIASDGLISVYKLRTGEYQVNVGPLTDGKVHVLIFDDIPPTYTYGYTWDVITPAP